MSPAGNGAPSRPSGIVLAGGGSTRFGRDKLAELVEGRTLLERAVDAVSGVCSEVIVALPPDGTDASPDALRRLPLDRSAVGVPLRVVHDDREHAGPLHGIVAGLEQAREPIVLVVAGDMPDLQPPVLALLAGRLTATDVDAAALVHRGRLMPLPCAVRNGAALVHARRLIAAGEASVVALLRALGAAQIAEFEWRGLDPAAATLRDVDRPGDLRPDDQR